MMVVGMAANPLVPTRFGRLFQCCGTVGRGTAVDAAPLSARSGVPIHGTRRFATHADNVAAARLNVAAEMFRAITHTLSLNDTWQSSTTAMLLVSSEAPRYIGLIVAPSCPSFAAPA